MKWMLVLLLCILIVPVVFGADEFEQVSLIDKMNRLPDDVVNRCKAEIDVGMDVIEAKVDARLEGLPVLISGLVATAVIVGSILGNGLALFIFRSSYVRRLKSVSALRKDLMLVRTDMSKVKTDLDKHFEQLHKINDEYNLRLNQYFKGVSK